MTCLARSAKLLLLLALVATTLPAIGCTSMGVQQLDLLGLFSPRRPEPPPAGAPAYSVALVSAEGKPDEFRMPLSEPITVQQALEQSGALRTFHRQRIAIERLEPNSNRRHRMNVQFDRAARTVSVETDYALLPGDRLVVEEDTTTLIEETFESVTGPLNSLMR